MNDLSIKNSDDVELNFDGELIHQAESVVSLEDGRHRKFLVSAYAVEGGGYVSSIEYQTDCSQEKPVVIFEQTDVFEDVETFFYAFDVCELMLPIKRLSLDEKADRERRTRKISQKFETMMFEFLDAAKRSAEEHHFGDRIEEPAKTGSLWGLFKSK
jgi:hypothetical protein